MENLDLELYSLSNLFRWYLCVAVPAMVVSILLEACLWLSRSSIFGRLAPGALLPVLNPFRFLHGPHRERLLSAMLVPPIRLSSSSESLGVSSVSLLERDLRTEILWLELRAEVPVMVLSSLLEACL